MSEPAATHERTTARMFHDDMTLREAKNLLREAVYDGAECPCCTQYAKVYKRTINSQMAQTLITMHRAQTGDEWLHLPTLLGRKQADEAKLRYWGLIEEQPGVRDDGSARVGWWRLTALGARFALGVAAVPKYALVYNGRCLGFDGPRVTIQDALGDRFNYDDLMRGAA